MSDKKEFRFKARDGRTTEWQDIREGELPKALANACKELNDDHVNLQIRDKLNS